MSPRSAKRRVLPSVVALVALILPAATSTAADVPSGVTAWLGTWHANFGTLFFDDVHRARSEITDVNGRRPRYWAASGTWARPGRKTQRFTGTIIGGKHRFRTFAGCWHPPDPAVSCGSILIYRTGKRLTGGYWKACRQNCPSHHPWKGSKTSGAWRVGFRFTQEGPSLGSPSQRTQIGGAGAVIWRHDPDNGRPGRPTDDSRVFLVVDGPGANQRELTVAMKVGRYEVVDDLPIVTLRGRVTKSSDERCAVGEVVEVTLTDGRKRAADRIALDPERRSCRRKARWSSLGRGDVDVFIDFARQTL